MPENIAVDLKAVQITLLLPLWGRAVELQKKHPLLIDNKASEITNKLDYDFTMIAKNIHPVTQFEWICRSIHIDRTIKEFLLKYPKATIVNVGCGLDTTFDRVDNGNLCWYDLDLPEVIELRKKFIPESERRKFISCSFLNDCWLSELHAEENILFIAAGVLYYFEENQIKDIFNKLSLSFPGTEIVFDASSPIGVKAANKQVIQGSGLDEKSFLKWGLQTATDIPKWNNKISIIKEYPMFKNMMKGLSFRNKIFAKLSDHYKIMYMVHLKI
jgi:O-methyltransferase involved in polyketide biosynthesis